MQKSQEEGRDCFCKKKKSSKWSLSQRAVPLAHPWVSKARFFHGVAQMISAWFTLKTSFDCTLWLDLSHVWLSCCSWQRSQNLEPMGARLQMVLEHCNPTSAQHSSVKRSHQWSSYTAWRGEGEKKGFYFIQRLKSSSSWTIPTIQN